VNFGQQLLIATHTQCAEFNEFPRIQWRGAARRAGSPSVRSVGPDRAMCCNCAQAIVDSGD